MTETLPIGDESNQSLQERIDAAEAGTIIDLGGAYWPGNLSINKSITLTNGYVDTVSAIGTFDGLVFDNITFVSASTEKNLDSNPAALYIQGYGGAIKNVIVRECDFVAPELDGTTIAITTSGSVEGVLVENSTIDGYTMSAYHNPGAADIAYENNVISNIQSGIAFVGINGVTVEGNTFQNANGIRLEPSWTDTDVKCSDISISQNRFVSVSSESSSRYAVRLQNSSGVSGVDSDTPIDLSYNFWGSDEPDFENLIIMPDGTQVVTEPYYEAITMRPEDLNTYVPPINIPDTYDIDLIVSDGGEAKTNLSNASAGTTITVTVTPDEGYELDYITVDGERISGTTFKMPDHDVTVRVYFTDGSAVLPFTDVSANQWFYDAISYVYTNGMMEGDSATTFNPDGQMTRAMFWAVLGRIDGATITGSNWVETARSWAMAEGVSDGTNPNDYVTREMMVTMLWRYAGEPASEESLSGYSDAANVSDWAAEAMSWALETGVIEGVTATTLQPQGTATRAQCATIFMRYDMI